MQRMSVECPACEKTTPHVVLKEGAHALVQCAICGSVHTCAPEGQGYESLVRVVVSSGGDTSVMKVSVRNDDVLEVGEQRLFEQEGEEGGGVVKLCEITALEVKGRRRGQAHGYEVDTVWSRAIDEVELKVSYPDDRITHSLCVKVEGDAEIEIGKTYRFEGKLLKVDKIKIRNSGYISRKGGTAPAHTIKRVFAKRVGDR